MATPELIGAWLSIFLTLCVFSYLYGDNPIYKFAEHLFLGVSIGIGVVEQYHSALQPNLMDQLATGRLWSIIPLILVIFLFARVAGKQVSWLARIPIAFFVAAYAGVKVTGEANANLMTQVAQSMPNLQQLHATHGWWHWEADGAGVISGVFVLVGLIACLLHFYFSAPQSRPLQAVSRFGVLVLMLAFGASFGYTVMGRISLAIGRVQELLGLDIPAAEAAIVQPRTATLVSLAVIIAVLALWRMQQRRQEQAS